ncbi:MAG: ATP-binding protein [bacterium]|nr:ATP-binding protein [bacterium]
MTEIDQTRKGELEFPRARAQIEAELESFMSGGQAGGMAEVPALSFEKGETRFAFPVNTISKEQTFDALNLIKDNIENIRVHTFEPGYLVFQDLGPSLYSNRQNPMEGIKFKFVSISSSHRIEIVRKGNLTQDELQACINIFRLFHPREGEAVDPARQLAELGVSVYQRAQDDQDHDQDAAGSGADDGQSGSQEQAGDSGAAPTAGFTRKHGFAGYKKTKQEVLESVILPLKHPEVFTNVARMTRGVETGVLPRAVLFEGPPGVGKTSMARIIAVETGIPMVYVPVENILSKFYGESAQNLGRIFDVAAAYEKVILFLDEIDSLAGSREGGLFEATRRVLSVLLRKIDGFDTRDGILTIGATNRTQDLDGALLSRFDTIIRFPLPNASERAGIFRRYARHLETGDLEQLARGSEGLSGRAIQDVCEYAERRWARTIIAGGGDLNASPPPAEHYLEITGEKSKKLENLENDDF